MAFRHYTLELLAPLLQGGTLPNRRVAAFSTPDIIASREVIQAHFPKLSYDGVVRREDGFEILNWHKGHGITDHVLDTKDFFAAQGYTFTAFDLVEGRGGEITCDLCVALPPDYHGFYGLVFDCIGNQVADPFACLRNAADLVAPGGVVVHQTPVTMVNQGYYAISPLLYRDFYEANGFEVLHHKMVHGVYTRKGPDLDPTDKRMRDVPEDSMNLFAARRVSSGWPFRRPVMKKFLDKPTCKWEGPLRY